MQPHHTHSDLASALQFCCSLQQELLLLPWPPGMLRWASCAPQYDAGGTVLLWRGLRMQCGVSWGVPLQRKPLATGMLVAG